jgi:hypothetical protein
MEKEAEKMISCVRCEKWFTCEKVKALKEIWNAEPKVRDEMWHDKAMNCEEYEEFRRRARDLSRL